MPAVLPQTMSYNRGCTVPGYRDDEYSAGNPLSTVVVRFSSLGDVVLAGAVTGQLAPVIFVTLERYAEVAENLPGVTEVRTWESHGRSAFDGATRIVDLHASLRSRYATAFQGAAVHRIKRHDLQRRFRVAFKAPPAPRVIDRYARAANVSIPKNPWLSSPKGEQLLLIPGAQHPTKRWPTDQWIALGKSWKGPITVLGSPAESPLVDEIANAIGNRANALAEKGFTQTLEIMQSARLAVGGDTGLVHLAAAYGVPVVGLFGPTRPEDGHWCHTGSVGQVDLPCRPCSRHGGSHCPVGDHACMNSILVKDVLHAMEGV